MCSKDRVSDGSSARLSCVFSKGLYDDSFLFEPQLSSRMAFEHESESSTRINLRESLVLGEKGVHGAIMVYC